MAPRKRTPRSKSTKPPKRLPPGVSRICATPTQALADILSILVNEEEAVKADIVSIYFLLVGPEDDDVFEIIHSNHAYDLGGRLLGAATAMVAMGDEE